MSKPSRTVHTGKCCCEDDMIFQLDGLLDSCYTCKYAIMVMFRQSIMVEKHCKNCQDCVDIITEYFPFDIDSKKLKEKMKPPIIVQDMTECNVCVIKKKSIQKIRKKYDESTNTPYVCFFCQFLM